MLAASLISVLPELFPPSDEEDEPLSSDLPSELASLEESDPPELASDEASDEESDDISEEASDDASDEELEAVIALEDESSSVCILTIGGNL